MRFGELSREPLPLLRLEVRQHDAQCEWLLRANDCWDSALPARERELNETFQALRDAISVRNFLFACLPEVRNASFKAYRRTEPLELIITGEASRDDEPPFRVSSVVMQAKLYGFRFVLSEEVLETLSSSESSLEFTTQ